MQVSTKIRKIREFKGFSQEFMAAQLSMSQATYSKLEKNDKSVNFDNIKDIAKVLSVDPMQLLTFDEQQVFNNDNQKGGNAGNLIIQAYSEKERHLYEEKIKAKEQIIEEKITYIQDLKEAIKHLRADKSELRKALQESKFLNK
ncbi:MAG: helix-turn-helix transcriptional regulator [Bacteroidetes bacterium]|nr:helix-turn-helix transcriptional regulator [Bacteroidota bacterium]